MSAGYVMRRLGAFLVVVWFAVTFSFFIPRTPQIIATLAPSTQRLMGPQVAREAAEEDSPQPGYYDLVFGLHKPLPEQYLNYLGRLVRLDLGRSMYHYPTGVREIIAMALPWTVGLLGVGTLLGFGLGSALGALLAWPRTPGWVGFLTGPLVTLSAIPFYLLGLILAYVFCVLLRWLPLGGGYPLLVIPGWNWAFVLGALRHSILPAAAIALSSLGFWALWMRALMVMALGEDYMIMAEAKGLRDRTLMFRYAAANAILPQTTALAISVGTIVTGAVLVEAVFAYPGMGSVLKQAVLMQDYTLMQGVGLVLILAIALATLLLDLALPLLDPRIRPTS